MTGLIKAKKPELTDLCERHRVERLDLFGSALQADFDSTRSDLDFLVEFSPMSPQEHAGAYFGLLEGQENLFLRQETLVECCGCGQPEGQLEGVGV